MSQPGRHYPALRDLASTAGSTTPLSRCLDAARRAGRRDAAAPLRPVRHPPRPHDSRRPRPQQWFGRTTILVQYWRDFDSLDRFAKDRDLPHLEPWRRFNRAVRASGDVGIWHETFKIRAGEYEAVYGNMPIFGLAAAARHLPTAQKANTAAAQIGKPTAQQTSRLSSHTEAGGALNAVRPGGHTLREMPIQA